MRWVELNWLENAELLGRIGRSSLASILDLVAPVLAQQGLALPQPGLADARYFAELAAVLQGQPIKVAVYLLPFMSASAPAPEGPRTRATVPAAGSPRYALHREGALWRLILADQPAILIHEQGLCYVAEMLSHPHEGIAKLALATKYSTAKANGGGLEVYNPATGQYEAPACTQAVQEGALAGDEREARRAYQQRARELAEVLEDATESEAAKDEARAELEELAAHLARDSRPHRDASKAAGDAINSAFKKLLRNLESPEGATASPPSVGRGLAEHLRRYLVIPSRRYAAPTARHARGELTGCLLYEPPAGVVWVVSQGGGA